jgi:cytochrome c peroxidase
MKKLSIYFFVTSCIACCWIPAQAATTRAVLGQQLFFDKNLSLTGNQSCADCHNPQAGFVDNRNNGVGAAASLGDDGISLGDRTAPTAAYARFSPVFHYDREKKRYVGGQFWDGRASDLAAQAGGPPLNPIEMGMPDKTAVVARIENNAIYRDAFTELYGATIFSDAEQAYAAMADAIAAFEQTDFFAPFDSRYDRYLKGKYELSAQEELGMALFFSNNNTNCSTCHVLKGEDQAGETFTNYEYHNIGTPTNHALRRKNGVGTDTRDQGLLANPAVDDARHAGKFKVPTLRNIAITAPYMHNGVFRDLRTVIEFYDQYNNLERRLNPETGNPWRVAEIDATINVEDLKAKKLTDAKIDALVAFLRLLTDRRYEYLLPE